MRIARRYRTGQRWGCAAVSFAAGLAGLACATGAGPDVVYSYEELVAAVRPRVPDAQPGELVVPFQVTPEMVERARELTRGSRSEYELAQTLMASITNREGFGLEYEPVATSLPEHTLERGHGNCLALTSIYVGLARELGLFAYYIDASDRVHDIRREQELIVDSGHIAAVVRTERGYTLVDYDGVVVHYRTFRVIDDIAALAHYYNNLGYELIDAALERGEPVPWGEVRRTFELATLVSAGFARAHNNLGVAYTRLGQPDEAEKQYLAAIEADSSFAAPHQNLGNLRFAVGELDAAIAAYDRAVAIEGRNPFLHYHRGVALYRKGKLEAAAKAFERASGLKRDYIEPRNLLAQIYDQLGRHEEADKIRRAVRLLRAEQQARGTTQ